MILTFLLTPLLGLATTLLVETILGLAIDKSALGLIETRITSRKRHKKLAILEAQQYSEELKKYKDKALEKGSTLSKIKEEAQSIVDEYNTSREEGSQLKFENGVFAIVKVQESIFSQVAKVLTEKKELTGKSVNLALTE